MNRSFVLQRRAHASGAAVASWILPGVRVRVSLGTELRDRCEQASRRGESCSQCSQHLSCSPPSPAPSKILLPPQGGAELAEACGGVPAEGCLWLCGWEPPLLGKGNGARCRWRRRRKFGSGVSPRAPARDASWCAKRWALVFPSAQQGEPCFGGAFPQGTAFHVDRYVLDLSLMPFQVAGGQVCIL